MKRFTQAEWQAIQEALNARIAGGRENDVFDGLSDAEFDKAFAAYETALTKVQERIHGQR